ncbi:MAG: potassium channel family protein [Anaerolineae bacterium]
MIPFALAFVSLARLFKQLLQRPESRALLLTAFSVIAIGTVFYHGVEGWSWLDAAYFCVVTMATIGYGDLTPKTDAGKLFTIVYILIGLGVISGFFAVLGETVLRQRGLLLGRSATPDQSAER